jgi:hypothetical protein
MITTIFTLLAVLSYPATCIVIGQTSVTTGRRCFLTLGMLCLIVRPVSNRGLTPLVASRLFYCNDLTRRLSPLLGQSNERRAIYDHAQN